MLKVADDLSKDSQWGESYRSQVQWAQEREKRRCGRMWLSLAVKRNEIKVWLKEANEVGVFFCKRRQLNMIMVIGKMPFTRVVAGAEEWARVRQALVQGGRVIFRERERRSQESPDPLCLTLPLLDSALAWAHRVTLLCSPHELALLTFPTEDLGEGRWFIPFPSPKCVPAPSIVGAQHCQVT